jgi:hypothetical protein
MSTDPRSKRKAMLSKQDEKEEEKSDSPRPDYPDIDEARLSQGPVRKKKLKEGR